jgi:hypothetical protein
VTVLGAALGTMAVGRLGLGALSIANPAAAARGFGMDAAVTPELSYMARIFGIRAIALGSGYLLSDGSARRLWQRLAFACDVSDTLTGAAHLRRGDLPGNAAVALTTLTGTYAAIGAARITADAFGSE